MKLALDATMSDAPGTRFSYNNKAANLLAGLVEKAAGRKLDDFLKQRLFTPMEITDFKWQRDLAGNRMAWRVSGCGRPTSPKSAS